MIGKRFAACLILGAVSTATSFDGPCIRVLPDEVEYCPDCPGFQACLCLYTGHECPGYRISCFTREKTEAGGNLTVFDTQYTCWQQRQCKSMGGGTCDPVANPCIQYGVALSILKIKSEQDAAFCGSALN